MKKHKIVALYGKAGSGKDTILQYLSSLPLYKTQIHKIVSSTTRPPRQGEVNGVAYNFLTEHEFAAQVLDGTMLEATSFRGWYYGTSIEELSTRLINIGVFNIDGLDILSTDDRLELYPIFIEARDKTRILRQLNREHDPDVHEIVRRFTADEKDFCRDYIWKPALVVDNDDEGAIQFNVRPLTDFITKLADKSDCG